jgi:hypothetical protein
MVFCGKTTSQASEKLGIKIIYIFLVLDRFEYDGADYNRS